MNILLLGLMAKIHILANNCVDKYIFTDVLDASEESIAMLPCHSYEITSKKVRPAFSFLDKLKLKTVLKVKIPYKTDSLKISVRNLK